MMFGSMVSSALSHKLGLRTTMVLGAILLDFVVFGQIMAAWRAQQMSLETYETDSQNNFLLSFFTDKGVVILALIVSACIAGFAQSLMWVCQGEYFAICASPQNKGFFFGMFWTISYSSQIFGNLLGSSLIDYVSPLMFYYIMASIMFVAMIGFYILLKDLPSQE